MGNQILVHGLRKTVLFEQKYDKVITDMTSGENKTEIMQQVLKIQQISLLPKYIKLISRGIFPHVCLHT
jgi:hypothetical protein